ncbi:MAG: hypothetical protein Harvfovirus16_1 [Harvfovirus sp.]|uniref:Uncharacterized protein n=1 Tax=Harvfovirus sp. TaxID=2487768 RepID=A0A3G5A4F6_9VIRU|nr:MAG: hypothetical protein Harvfovirus16_1 [Harvfovirus sp.]
MSDFVRTSTNDILSSFKVNGVWHNQTVAVKLEKIVLRELYQIIMNPSVDKYFGDHEFRDILCWIIN